MKALVFQSPFCLIVEEKPDLYPLPDEVLIRVKACGICGSDIYGYTGKTGRRISPMIMGHEFSGVVEAAGNLCCRIKVGQRVVVQPIISCGHCEACLKGQTNRCPEKQCLGTMSLNGAMAEQICVPERNVKILPRSVSFVAGAVVEPLAVAFRAVNSLDVHNKTVFVIGSGTIGLMAQMILIEHGAGKLIVSDMSNYRLDYAQNVGSHHVINPTTENVQQTINRLTGQCGVDIAIEAVGIGPTVNQALESLKLGGQCVWIGNNAKQIEINMQHIVTHEISIFGTYSYSDSEFQQAIDLVANQTINTGQLIDKQVVLEEAPTYFDSLSHGSDRPIKCVIVF
jgi:2-desacetyl-2-hydroxyethyl bacteriochlorophyllide A dehydrogenase